MLDFFMGSIVHFLLHCLLARPAEVYHHQNKHYEAIHHAVGLRLHRFTELHHNIHQNLEKAKFILCIPAIFDGLRQIKLYLKKADDQDRKNAGPLISEKEVTLYHDLEVKECNQAKRDFGNSYS
jgi:hypothetical protein